MSTRTSNRIVPCIWFSDESEAAAEFYTRLLPDGRILAVARYPESFDNPGGKPRGSVMTVDFEVGGQRFTALDGGPIFRPNPSISFFLRADDAAHAEHLYGVLQDGGRVLMPLGSYAWSPHYAWVEDRFGVSWQIIVDTSDTSRPRIVPCLMFAGPQHGRAEEAIQAYTRAFPESRIGDLVRYRKDEGPEGKLVHGRFTLAGHEFTAMDSGAPQDTTFSEGLSLQIMCDTQAEIDHYWDVLVQDGGQHGPCGWLKDRFGVSWQVCPAQFIDWYTHPDPAARDRAFSAMLKMHKLDIAELERALRGE